jgi:hypothetical protein
MTDILNTIQSYTNRIDSPGNILYGCILVLIIVYSAVIPLEYKRFADSTLGRILGLAAVYATIHQLGWIYGLLTAMAFLLLLHGGTKVNEEGFNGGGSVTEKKTDGTNRWWVDKVLGEQTTAIATDQVKTSAVGCS